MPEEKVLLEPSVELEQIGPCKYKMIVEVSSEKIKTRLEAMLNELQKTAFVPGFRVGHAPKDLILRKQRKLIMETLKQEIIQDSFEEAVKIKEVKPIEQPKIDLSIYHIREDESLRYETSFEVMPEIILIEYKGIKLKKMKVDVNEQEVNDYINLLRSRSVEYQPSPESLAAENDLVVCDVEFYDGEKLIRREENCNIILTSALNVLNIHAPELYKVFIDKKIGEEFVDQINIPENYFDETLAGKKLQMKIKMKSIKKPVLPELNDDFAKSQGLENLEELRQKVMDEITRLKEEQNIVNLKKQVVSYLVDNTKFPIPETLLASFTQDMQTRIRTQMLVEGKTSEQIEAHLKQIEPEIRQIAETEIRKFLILQKIADKERIFVTEDIINREIERIAEMEGIWATELKSKLEQTGDIKTLRQVKREDMTLDFIIQNAIIEEIDLQQV